MNAKYNEEDDYEFIQTDPDYVIVENVEESFLDFFLRINPDMEKAAKILIEYYSST
jgi:UDP-N-acetylmuramate-alanine ligase